MAGRFIKICSSFVVESTLTEASRSHFTGLSQFLSLVLRKLCRNLVTQA